MTTRTPAFNGVYDLAKEVDWEAAYREYLLRIFNFFRYRVGDRALAEDLTATTFEKAWSGRSRFRRDLSAFSTWLFTYGGRLTNREIARLTRLSESIVGVILYRVVEKLRIEMDVDHER